MTYTNTDYAKEAASFTNRKVVDWMVNLLTTHCTDITFDLTAIQNEIEQSNFIFLSESGTSLYMDFKGNRQMKIVFSCDHFDFNYAYEVNNDFPNGRHVVSVNEKEGDSISKAIQQFVELVKMNAFASEVDQIISTAANESYVLNDLHFRNDGKNSRHVADFSITADGVLWNLCDPPEVHYLIASGSGGHVTLQEFAKGKLNDFVLQHFGADVLEEAKKNVTYRLTLT